MYGTASNAASATSRLREIARKRELDKAVVRQLATCRWVEEHRNLLVVGATGTGKTFAACAFAQQACRRASGLSTVALPASSTSACPRRRHYLRLPTKLALIDELLVDDLGLDAGPAPASRGTVTVRSTTGGDP